MDTTIFLAGFTLAVITEGITEYIFADTPLKPWLKYIALGMGVLLTVLYRVDILAELGFFTPVPYAGEVLTGLLIGRGSNYVNDLATLLQRKPVPPSA